MKMYSPNFERNYKWLLKYKDVFTFDASDATNKKVIHNELGKSAKECFFIFDSKGDIIPTVEPELLFCIHKCKGGINFQIKEWAEDRAKGWLGLYEFELITKEFELLEWMIKAVENQMHKLRSHFDFIGFKNLLRL